MPTIQESLIQRDSSGQNLPFIPSYLDDAGLTPSQFRLVCRVSRRGNCFESIANMAKGCGLAINTLKTNLPRLVAMRVLSKTTRVGATSIYSINPFDQWRIERGSKLQPAKKTPWAAEHTTPETKQQPSHPAQSTPHKGSPFQGSPTKASKFTSSSFIPR